MSNHTFVVVAYKESEYLEQCIKSLENQSVKSNIIVATSTDNDYIRSICDSHGLNMYVSPNPSDIADDWNFAVSCVESEYFTLAHQDDIYEPEYAARALHTLTHSKNPIIYFSDYYEIRDGKKTFTNTNLKVKRILLSPLRCNALSGLRVVKRRVLSVGNPICCPAVTYVKSNMVSPLFNKGFKSNIDWQTWERLSKLSGQFLYDSQKLMGHRVHDESTTTEIINSNQRTLEDFEMLSKFWPKSIARLINRVYKNAEISNQ